MSSAARAWLPDGAFERSAARRVLSPVLEAWSNDWFVDAMISLADVREADRATGLHGLVVDRPGQPTTISLTARGKRLLFETACSVDLAEIELSDTDRRLVDILVEEIASDLLARLDAMLEVPRVHDTPSHSLVLTLKGRDLLTINVSRSLLASWLKSGMPQPRGREGTLTKRSRAIGETTLSLDAVVGSASIALADLTHLAIGDILILDQALDAGVAMTLSSSGRP